MMGQIAAEDHWLDADGNVTTDSEQAATLLIRKGQEMSKEVAEMIGKVAQPESEEGEGKEAKSEAPTANKSEKPTKNKGVK